MNSFWLYCIVTISKKSLISSESFIIFYFNQQMIAKKEFYTHKSINCFKVKYLWLWIPMKCSSHIKIKLLCHFCEHWHLLKHPFWQKLYLENWQKKYEMNETNFVFCISVRTISCSRKRYEILYKALSLWLLILS